MKEYRITVMHWLTKKVESLQIFAYDEEEAKETLLRMMGSNWEVQNIRLVPKGGM